MVSSEFEPLLNVAKACVLRHGAEVVELVVRGDQLHRVVELYVDSEPGISLGHCQEISKSLIQEIELQSLINGSYRLDVSSPGIDRPLKHPWQYRKHLGRNVEVTWEASGSRHTTAGKLAVVDNDGIVLETVKGGDGQRLGFELLIETKVKTPW